MVHGVLTFSGFSMPMARWDAATDTVTFDWPAIEKAAAEKGGSLEGMTLFCRLIEDHKKRSFAGDPMLDEWQPMTTAPRDGTRVLAYAAEDAADTQPQIVKWKDGMWIIAWDGETWRYGEPFTHWMPLPEPPASRQ
jgi:predicted lipoprotein with Yx(FWY)xxD motif